ncbi:MAG: hypothetical protein WAS56_03530 [Saprospiraceae bacterium]|nr:hypothetical protein [Saprospiraceae bacterium]MBK7466398.1 hypothetical protein [Saprospiraceae bacterium]
MKIKLYLLLLFFTFMSIYSFAQTKPKNPPPKKSDVIDVFGNEINNSSEPTNDGGFKATNMLKLDIVQPFLGNFLFSFERTLMRRLGAELTAGPTLGTTISKAISLFDEFDNDTKGASKFGLYYGAQLKYYTDVYDAPEGWYFGLGFKHSNTKFEKLEIGNFLPSQSLKSIKNIEYARISIGYTNIWDRFVSEYYITLGLKKTAKEYYNYKTNGITSVDGNNDFGFSFGYKLGISF